MTQPAIQETARHLPRVLGRWDLTFLCVAAITNLNIVPVVASGGPVMVWLWLAALIFFFWPQGVACIELGLRYPGEGGLYLWAKEAFGDFHGFMCGWCYWTTNMFFIPSLLFYLAGISAFIIGNGTSSLAENRPFFFAVTLGLLWFTVILNICGMGVGKWVNNIGGIGNVIVAAVLVGLGIFCYLRRGTDLTAHSFTVEHFDWQLISSFGVICFGLVGLELCSVMGDEIRDPVRTLPKAVLWGGVLAGALYVGSTVSLLTSVNQREITIVQGILQAVVKMTENTALVWLLPPLALLMAAAIAGSTSAWVAGSARIVFVSGCDRYLPKGLGKLHPRFSTPYVALLSQATLMTGILSMSFVGASVHEAYVTLLDLAVVLQMVSYLYLFASLLRITLRDQEKTGRFSRNKLLAAATGGLVTATLGMCVAFVPSHQIDSIWRFETKMVIGTSLFLGVAAFLFHYYSKQKARA